MRRNLTPVRFFVWSFAVVILVGTVLLTLPISSEAHRFTNPVTALFTATSATCVTGLVVEDTASYWSLFGEIVILLLIQIGGLGYMTVATFFLIFSNRKITLRQRFILKEGLNVYRLTGIVSFARTLFFTVLFFEGFGALVLFLRFLKDFSPLKAMWMGIFHSISAFCNAGFSITGGFKSLTGYVNDLTVNITMMILIVCGGIGFYVLVEIFNALRARFKNEERRKFSLHTRIVLKATFTLIIIGTVLIMLFEWNNPETLGALNLRGKILSSFFQAITPRTAGFNTIDIASLHQTTLLEMICLMFIGGSPGGTAGGVKTTTFTIILALLIHAYRERIPITITGRTIKLKTIRRALFIAGFAILVILISTMVILWNQGDEFTLSQVLFEVVSAFGTVGLSTGITANLSILSRIVIIATMFIGRVGPLSFILSITTRSKVAVPAYPEEEVAVG